MTGLEYKIWEPFRWTWFSYCWLVKKLEADQVKAHETMLETKYANLRGWWKQTTYKWLEFLTRFSGFCNMSEVGHSLGCHIHLQVPDRDRPELEKVSLICSFQKSHGAILSLKSVLFVVSKKTCTDSFHVVLCCTFTGKGTLLLCTKRDDTVLPG